jgi:hypothetical protein
LLYQLGSEILLRFPFVLCRARPYLTSRIFSIHQSLYGNCLKVCRQIVYFTRDLMTQASRRCLINLSNGHMIYTYSTWFKQRLAFLCKHLATLRPPDCVCSIILVMADDRRKGAHLVLLRGSSS